MNYKAKLKRKPFHVLLKNITRAQFSNVETISRFDLMSGLIKKDHYCPLNPFFHCALSLETDNKQFEHGAELTPSGQ